jgi:hypothetical protein
MSDYAPWGSDVPISLPEPSPVKNVRVDMGGFGFTENGIAHQFDDATLENYLPNFAPRQSDMS